MSTKHENALELGSSRTKRLLAAGATALVASLAMASPSWAVVNAPHNVTVSPDSDIVAATGYELRESLTVEVIRDGVVIGTAAGQSQDLGGGLVGLEVNHGPAGTAQPGDCFDGFTPDIVGGDLVRVTSTGIAPRVEETAVPKISFASDPTTDPATGDIVLTGTALDAAGAPLPVGQLAGEMRQEDPRIRLSPALTVDTSGNFTATYSSNLTAAEKQAVLNPDNGHALTWENANATETAIAELVGAPSPAPGCTAPRSANDVTAFDDKVVNLNSGDLVINGTAMATPTAETTAVKGTVTSSGSGAPVPFTATLSATASAGQKTWSATVPRVQLDDRLALPDGTLTVAPTYTVSGTDMAGATKTIEKDTVAPVVTANPPGGTAHNGSVSVSLNAGGDPVRYTIDGNAPDNNSRIYDGTPIRLTESGTVRAASTDAAGNSRGPASFAYTVRQATALTLNSSLVATTIGQATTLSGNLSSNGVDQGGKPVIIEQRQAGTAGPFAAVRTVATDAGGNYSASLVPQKNTEYRARFAEQAELQARSSAPRTVNVRAAVTENLSLATLRLGQSLTISGAVKPAHAGKPVKLEIRRGGVLISSRLVMLNAASQYSLTYKPPTSAGYSVRAVFAADADHLGNVSPTKSFRVTS